MQCCSEVWEERGRRGLFNKSRSGFSCSLISTLWSNGMSWHNLSSLAHWEILMTCCVILKGRLDHLIRQLSQAWVFKSWRKAWWLLPTQCFQISARLAKIIISQFTLFIHIPCKHYKNSEKKSHKKACYSSIKFPLVLCKCFYNPTPFQ